MENGGCLRLEYQTLLQKNLIKEEDVTCTGSLLLRRHGKRYDYDDSLLSCKTKSGNKVLKEVTPTDTTGCELVNWKCL